MASLPLLLLLILCGSLHACTPRPLTEKDTTKYHFNKELDNVKDNKLEENQALQQKVTNDEINICLSCSSASTLKEVIVGSTFQTGTPSLIAAKAERGHARSMLGPAQHNVEETMVINTNENAEDIVEDYAQPHRKAPIHNEKP